MSKETLTQEQPHVLLQDLLKEVRINLEQKTGIHQTVVQELPVVNIQAPPGTGKTETAANTVEMLEKTHADKRCIVVSPTNEANEKIAHACVKAKHRFGTDPNQKDYDILLLESRFANVQSAKTREAVIKPIQAEDDSINRLKIQYHIVRILEEVNDMEVTQKQPNSFKQSLKAGTKRHEPNLKGHRS